MSATPLMQQYFTIKEQYSDALLFFQVGDFYELFFEDAQRAAAFLGIALTARGKNKGEPIPLCGVPVHAVNHYVAKLIKGGFNVAICEQLEPPQQGKVVKRGVTQVLTPGTLTDSNLLDEKSASYLFSFFAHDDCWAIVCGELLTAQLFATVIPNSERMLETELSRFFPDEVLVPEVISPTFGKLFKRLGYVAASISPKLVHCEQADQWIYESFSKHAVDRVTSEASMQTALRYFYAYVHRNQRGVLNQFSHLTFYQPEDFLLLDSATQRNLEITRNNRDGSSKQTLFAVLDCAASAMGSRMVKKWLQRPLLNKEAIMQRHDAVEALQDDAGLMHQLRTLLSRLGDIERTVGRIMLNRAPVHDFIALRHSLTCLPALIDLLTRFDSVPLFTVICTHLRGFNPLLQLLESAFYAEYNSDAIIKERFDKKLDEMKNLVHNSHEKIMALEVQEQRATGIQSLKIRYNQVHGYYIEVTKANLHLIPDYFVRQQTLVGKERYTTPSLQQLQGEIISARSHLEQVEQELFEQVKHQVTSYGASLRKLAHALAHLDALFSFANVAYQHGYVRPRFNEEGRIDIKNGRHPIVEAQLDVPFIGNNTQLDNEQSLWIVTGPNMGGKSTYLRQVALISIMAQCGAFVPSRSADLPLIDRIFTRIGAGDNLAEGKSTFLVEMEETATICTQATSRSLVILDEVGRGTSTFDGLALAQSIVEFIYTQIGARCLFATHYHELTKLSNQFPGIKSYVMASRKTDAGILFLYRIKPGHADGSFGIDVAKLAGLPATILERAKHLLEAYKEKPNDGGMAMAQEMYRGAVQCACDKEEREREVLKVEDLKMQRELEQLDINDLSPRKAFELLCRWKELQQ